MSKLEIKSSFDSNSALFNKKVHVLKEPDFFFCEEEIRDNPMSNQSNEILYYQYMVGLSNLQSSGRYFLLRTT